MFIQDSFSVNVSGVRTNWELRVYPNGYDDENSGYLGIFVKHKEGNSHRYLIKSVVQVPKHLLLRTSMTMTTKMESTMQNLPFQP